MGLEDISRREFIRLTASAGAGLAFLPQDLYSKNTTMMKEGTAYLCNAEGQLTGDEMEWQRSMMIRNFRDAGVMFENVEILHDVESPSLSGFDTIFYFVEEFKDENYEGVLGLCQESAEGNSCRGLPRYRDWKSRLDFAYTPEEAYNHVSVIDTDMYPLAGEEEIPKNLDDKEKNRRINLKLMHEAGHVFGAGHVVKKSPIMTGARFGPYYLGHPEPDDYIRFHPINRGRMRTFIGEYKREPLPDKEFASRRYNDFLGRRVMHEAESFGDE